MSVQQREIQLMKTKTLLWLGFLFFVFQLTKAQTLTSQVDTTNIKIGEKIAFKIQVETDTTDLVVFPEGQTFMPLESFENNPIDTVINGRKFRLQKEYALTQFDSGRYTIPRQRVMINEKAFYTDSLQVLVNDVAVDTTKQKMYPIKPSIEIEEPFEISAILWWILGAIILGGLIFLIFFFRKKHKERKERQLPPYEKAMLTLKNLDESHALEHGEIKKYYSGLTDAVKRYIDEEIDDGALERTTSELTARLNELVANDKLKLSQDKIDELNNLLQRADLIKFAGGSTDILTAREDRKKVTLQIETIKTSKPEPTEEELLRDQEYREKLAKKKKRRKIIVGSVIGFLVIVIALFTFVGIKGYDYVQDKIIGSPTKDLVKGDWYRSEYGYPPVALTTPRVLVRQTADSILINPTQNVESFSYGSILGEYYINLEVVSSEQGIQIDLEKATGLISQFLESKGASNILTKQETFVANNGTEGVKISGTFNIANPINKEQTLKKEYEMIVFNHLNNIQMLTLVYDFENSYGEEITSKITSSIELIQEQE
ncbi:DUF4381 domain-containing protein [Mesonia sp. K7]|uniref:DUF4381 domain-containing protein n=1 Tax=Mesonia sp. K7 TaxID=2218606 RepID=UPI0011B38211|nr:DUF4381 domain-containing protein [Mesonia sp. K7]